MFFQKTQLDCGFSSLTRWIGLLTVSKSLPQLGYFFIYIQNNFGPTSNIAR